MKSTNSKSSTKNADFTLNSRQTSKQSNMQNQANEPLVIDYGEELDHAA